MPPETPAQRKARLRSMLEIERRYGKLWRDRRMGKKTKKGLMAEPLPPQERPSAKARELLRQDLRRLRAERITLRNYAKRLQETGATALGVDLGPSGSRRQLLRGLLEIVTHPRQRKVVADVLWAAQFIVSYNDPVAAVLLNRACDDTWLREIKRLKQEIKA